MKVLIVGSGGAGLAGFLAGRAHLGLVATSRRSIKNGSEYNQYFDLTEVEGKEVPLTEGDVYDTLKQMAKIVQLTLNQTKRIAKKLEGASREATCRNIWNFLYNHIQYKKDNPLREQLRTPIRSWRDRASGIDCDCYSIFISSILTNLGIPHSFRMAAYSGDFQLFSDALCLIQCELHDLRHLF